MKDVWEESNVEVKKINKKKIIITTVVAILVVFIIVLVGLYLSNEQARDWIDSKFSLI